MHDSSNATFISYRREVSQNIPFILCLKLTDANIDVFYDYRSIKSGRWLNIILNQITARPYFVLILAPGTLNRCKKDLNDVLLQEIRQAVDTKRIIIPLILPGFDWRDLKRNLPEKLATEIAAQNGLKWPKEPDWWEATLTELIQYRLPLTEHVGLTDVPNVDEPELQENKRLVEKQIVSFNTKRRNSYALLLGAAIIILFGTCILAWASSNSSAIWNILLTSATPPEGTLISLLVPTQFSTIATSFTPKIPLSLTSSVIHTPTLEAVPTATAFVTTTNLSSTNFIGFSATPTPSFSINPSELSVLLTAQRTNILSPSFTPTYAKITVISSANIRNGPGTNYAILDTVDIGTKFAVLAKTTASKEIWYLIILSNDERAWIWSGVTSANSTTLNVSTAVTIPPSPTYPNTGKGNDTSNTSTCPPSNGPPKYRDGQQIVAQTLIKVNSPWVPDIPAGSIGFVGVSCISGEGWYYTVLVPSLKDSSGYNANYGLNPNDERWK